MLPEDVGNNKKFTFKTSLLDLTTPPSPILGWDLSPTICVNIVSIGAYDHPKTKCY